MEYQTLAMGEADFTWSQTLLLGLAATVLSLFWYAAFNVRKVRKELLNQIGSPGEAELERLRASWAGILPWRPQRSDAWRYATDPASWPPDLEPEGLRRLLDAAAFPLTWVRRFFAWLAKRGGRLDWLNRKLQPLLGAENATLVWPIGLSVIALTITSYNPGVLILAIFGIAIAAEHLVSLQETHDAQTEFNQSQENFKTTLNAAESTLKSAQAETQRLQTDTLGQQRELLKIVTDILPFQTNVIWRASTLAQYAKPNTRISGVIKFWDIDDQWLDAFKTPLSDDEAKAAWNAYFAAPRSEGAEVPESYSLGYAMRQNAYGSKHFVTDFAKLPIIPTWKALTKDPRAFREILGVTWEVCVFNLAHEANLVTHFEKEETEFATPEDRFRFPRLATFRIGHAPFWFHAIGDAEASILLDYSQPSSSANPMKEVHALVKSLVAEELDEDMRHATVARLHEYLQWLYQHASRGTPWLAMVWRELLAELADTETELEGLDREGIRKLLGGSKAAKAFDEAQGFNVSHVAESVFILIRTLQARQELIGRHRKLFEEEADWSFAQRRDQFWKDEAEVFKAACAKPTVSIDTLDEELFL